MVTTSWEKSLLFIIHNERVPGMHLPPVILICKGKTCFVPSASSPIPHIFINFYQYWHPSYATNTLWRKKSSTPIYSYKRWFFFKMLPLLCLNLYHTVILQNFGTLKFQEQAITDHSKFRCLWALTWSLIIRAFYYPGQKNRYSRDIHKIDPQFDHVIWCDVDFDLQRELATRRGLRVASMSNRSSISHDITWSNCRSTSWTSRL